MAMVNPMVNPSAHPNSILSVARRLDVGVAWIAEILNITKENLVPGKRLTEHAIAYLAWSKNPEESDAVGFPYKNIFVTDATSVASPKDTGERVGTFLAHSIMYAKEIRISEVFRVETSTTQIAIKGKSGEYEPSTVLEFECGGLLYYCSSISVHTFGIKLHHVWGIFKA